MQLHAIPLTLRLLLTLLLGLWLCASPSLQAAPQDTPLAAALRIQLELRSSRHGQQLPWPQLAAFYSARDYLPAWVDEDGANAPAAALLKSLYRCADEGLSPATFPLPLLQRLWQGEGRQNRIDLELLLSATFFDYSRQLLSGQSEPQRSGQYWFIEVEQADSIALLQALLASDDFEAALKSLPPSHPAYRRLREALARYRQIEADGGWPTIPTGKKLRPGNRDPRVPLLRRRLQLEGELQFSPLKDRLLYDQALRYAVERFQLRHGLKQDGVIGPLTLAELNVPLSHRIDQIRLNMERWRWLPDQLGHRHIIVNIAAYQLSAYDHGERQFTMEAIIGSEENRTPQISGALDTIVFNPHWSIPKKIALEEVIPRQRRNPGYFASRGIRVFSRWDGEEELPAESIDWSNLQWDNFNLMLRQDPGPTNPLGKLKFLFDNNFHIYLHDTPAQQLFNHTERAFSHGCIRVEAPRRLAAFLLSSGPHSPWSESAVRSVIATGVTHEVALSPPVPVYLLYLTAWVGDDGAVHFRRDVYGEDELLLFDIEAGELF
jgi:murein L,D-transpeptidase YcbB/YkuD